MQVRKAERGKVGEDCVRACIGKSYHQGPPAFARTQNECDHRVTRESTEYGSDKVAKERGLHDHHDLSEPKTVADQHRC